MEILHGTENYRWTERTKTKAMTNNNDETKKTSALSRHIQRYETNPHHTLSYNQINYNIICSHTRNHSVNACTVLLGMVYLWIDIYTDCMPAVAATAFFYPSLAMKPILQMNMYRSHDLMFFFPSFICSQTFSVWTLFGKWNHFHSLLSLSLSIAFSASIIQHCWPIIVLLSNDIVLSMEMMRLNCLIITYIYEKIRRAENSPLSITFNAYALGSLISHI